MSKEIARVQYDDGDDDDDEYNCKETNDDFVLPSRTLMNYQARLSFDRLMLLLSFALSLFMSLLYLVSFFFSMYVVVSSIEIIVLCPVQDSRRRKAYTRTAIDIMYVKISLSLM